MTTRVKQIDLNLKRRIDPNNCTLDDFRSSDPPMRQCIEMAWIAAMTDLPVLILGESGTGKTLLSRAIHNSSPRAAKPFIAFNAAALSETLLDSQLFGHERGAFTGAHRPVRGKFELADEGTLFIDEIADMSSAAQAKILRAVEYGEFERLGSEKLRAAKVRLVSATHFEPDDFLVQENFRRDLFFRLSGMTIRIPPLRERQYDLPLLVAAEIEWAAADLEKTIRGLDPGALLTLLSYRWPGNLRELNRVIRAAVAMCEGDLLTRRELLLPAAEDPFVARAPLPSEPSSALTVSEADQDLTLESAERRHVLSVYRRFRGNKRRTAMALGISRSTLDRKLQSYGI